MHGDHAGDRKEHDMSIHDAINDLCRQARKLAPKVAEQAGISGCTMEHIPSGPRQRRAYLLEALALSLNHVSQDDGSEPLASDEEALAMYVPAELLTDEVRAEFASLRDPFRVASHDTAMGEPSRAARCRPRG